MSTLKLLFVCIENANRSQMAAAFANHFHGKHVAAYSAGSAPAQAVNLRAVQAMSELDIDISDATPVSLDHYVLQDFDAVVTMGCGDQCPTIKTKQRVEWSIEDPRNLPRAQFNQVRDTIKQAVDELITALMVDLGRVTHQPDSAQ